MRIGEFGGGESEREERANWRLCSSLIDSSIFSFISLACDSGDRMWRE